MDPFISKSRGLTTREKLAELSNASALEEFKTLQKRERPSKISFSITNATDALKKYSVLGDQSAYVTGYGNDVVKDAVSAKIRRLIADQKPFIVGFEYSVNTDADIPQFSQVAAFNQADFKQDKETYLNDYINEAKSSSKDEALSRFVGVKFVLDNSTDLYFEVLPGKTINITLNVKEYLNRNW